MTVLLPVKIGVKTIFLGDPVAGFTTLIAVTTFLGSVQLVTIGIIGEYLGRMFDETKQRPLYFLKEYKPSSLGDNSHKEPS